MSERMTTDNPQNMTDSMLNLAYVEDKLVHIRGMEEPFIDYIKRQCRKQGCDLDEMDDMELVEAIMDCGFSNPNCPIFLLHTIATQAAELRARLKCLEDLQEHGRLVELPCRVGDTVYDVSGGEIYEMAVVSFEIDECSCVNLSEDVNYGANGYDFSDFGESVFLSKAGAQAALEKWEK